MISEEINHITTQLTDFSDESKVWIYYSETSFENNTDEIKTQVNNFVQTWTSHGHEVIAKGFIISNQIILLVADITQSEVSGCSTDSSVKFIKTIESKFQLHFFSRENLYTFVDNKIISFPLAKITEMDRETQVFNPFFNSLGEWKKEFLKKVVESKYKRMLL